MKPTESWVAVAVVIRPHGLRGALMLKALTRTQEELLEAPLEVVHLRQRGRILQTLTLTRLGLHKGLPMAYFEGVADRTAAEQLVGCELVIPEDERWDLEEGQFYHDELIGIAVVERSTGRSLGTVLRVMDGPAHDYLVFPHPDGSGREVLLPFVHDVFVLLIDMEERRVEVALPEGLLEL